LFLGVFVFERWFVLGVIPRDIPMGVIAVDELRRKVYFWVVAH